VCPARHRFVGGFWTIPTSQPERTKPRIDAPKMAPFSRENPYNHPTTRKPVICQFPKNAHLISAVMADVYKKMKIWHRIQCPVLKKDELATLPSYQPFVILSALFLTKAVLCFQWTRLFCAD
jgi:hypothetical protein